jgi:hypothetical protein
MADIFARLAMPILEKLADGAWQNLCTDEDAYAAVSWRRLMLDGMGLGVAITRGWAEQQDETWARITPAGREALRIEREATRLWYIRSRGYFFRRDAQGYCEDRADAGHYTYEEALARTTNARGVTMHKVSEWPPEAGRRNAEVAQL